MEDRLYVTLHELEDRHWWFRGRREVIWALLRRAGIPPAPRILDAGCGTGRNLEEFARLGPVRGVDASPDAVRFCRARNVAPVVQAELEALPFDDASFDLVLACDVIEHIADDAAALTDLRRVTASGGRLLVTAPAYRWLWSHHDEIHHHKRRYTRPQLLRRVADAGWRPLVQTYFNALLLAPIAAARARERLLRGAPSSTDYDLTPRWMNAVLAWPMSAEARAIERGARFPAGVSIGVVCEAA